MTTSTLYNKFLFDQDINYLSVIDELNTKHYVIHSGFHGTRSQSEVVVVLQPHVHREPTS